MFRMSGNQHDAEDLTQETFITIARKLPTFNGDSSLKTWIYSIAINKYRDSLRYDRIRAHDQIDENRTLSSQNPLDDYMAQETEDRIRTAFYGLTEHYRAAFALVRFEGMTYKEAAQALGTTLETLRMRVHRAHLMLAERLKDTRK